VQTVLRLCPGCHGGLCNWQVFGAMKTVKMGVWENAMFAKLEYLRRREQHWLVRKAITLSMQYTMPIMMSSAVFVAAVSLTSTPTAATYVSRHDLEWWE
jgi:hypothetical protein